MKSYVINLERSPERLASFTAQARYAGIEFERFPAIDASLISDAELRDKLPARFEFQPMNAGEAALFLGHRGCWQRFLESNDEYCAVFEDDSLLSRQTAAFFALLEARETDFDILKIETTLKRMIVKAVAFGEIGGRAILVPNSWHSGTGGYILSRAGAKKLLDWSMLFADPIDQLMFNPASGLATSLVNLQLSPALSIQQQVLTPNDLAAPFRSTIKRAETKGLLFRHGLFIDARRVYRKYRESVARRLMSLSPQYQYLTIQFADEVKKST
jgi:glycosyl transferase, family 25